MQGQGIAKQLLERFEAQAHSLGYACGLGVATTDGFPVYSKRGYRMAAPYVGIACTRLTVAGSTAATLPRGGFELKVAVDDVSKAAALEELIVLDHQICGFERRQQLLAMGASVVATATVGSEVVGAVLGIIDSQSGAISLGPLLGDAAAGKALIAGVAATLPGDAQLAMFAFERGSFVEELKASGFTAVSSVAGTMVLGDVPLPGERERYLTIINPCFG